MNVLKLRSFAPGKCYYAFSVLAVVGRWGNQDENLYLSMYFPEDIIIVETVNLYKIRVSVISSE